MSRVDFDNHQAVTLGEVLRDGLEHLFRGGEMHEAIGAIDRRAGEFAGCLKCLPLLARKDFVDHRLHLILRCDSSLLKHPRVHFFSCVSCGPGVVFGIWVFGITNV